MNYIIASDLHGNAEALVEFKKVIASIIHDKIIFLGDLAGYEFTSENFVKDFLEIKNLFSIRGNCDYDAYHHDTGVINTPYLYEYFKSLKQGPVIIDGLFGVCHGSALAEKVYMYDPEDTVPTFNYMKNNKLQIMFFGHIHSEKYFVNDKHDTIFETKELTCMSEHHRYLICPGSLGKLKKSRDKGSFIIFNSSDNTIKLVEFPFTPA